MSSRLQQSDDVPVIDNRKIRRDREACQLSHSSLADPGLATMLRKPGVLTDRPGKPFDKSAPANCEHRTKQQAVGRISRVRSGLRSGRRRRRAKSRRRFSRRDCRAMMSFMRAAGRHSGFARHLDCGRRDKVIAAVRIRRQAMARMQRQQHVIAMCGYLCGKGKELLWAAAEAVKHDDGTASFAGWHRPE